MGPPDSFTYKFVSFASEEGRSILQPRKEQVLHYSSAKTGIKNYLKSLYLVFKIKRVRNTQTQQNLELSLSAQAAI